MEQQTVNAARELLESPRWFERWKGMTILAELGERELLLEYASGETEPGVLEVATAALHPAPVELVIQMLRPGRGNSRGDVLRFHIAKNNFLHAGSAIAALFEKSRDRLHPDVIEAAGLAYLKPMAPCLASYLRAPLISYAAALREQGREAVAGLSLSVSSDGTDEWSRASLCAVEAAVALRRMDQDVERAEVRRMLDELGSAMDPSRYCSPRTRAMLRWVAFDAGWESDPGPLLRLAGDKAPACLPDLLTTLLKRGEFRECERIARGAPEIYRWAKGFCFWPLANFLESRGLLDVVPFSGHAVSPLEPYVRARRFNVDPPPWWRWQ